MSSSKRWWSHAGRSVLLLAVLVVPACSGPCEEPAAKSNPVSATDRQALFDAHGELIRAYERGDANAFVALLDTTSDLLIFHPVMQNRFQGLTEARENLGRMFARLDETTWTEAHPALVVRGDVAWLTYNVLVESPSLDPPFVGRGTEVWVRGEGNWRLAHGHWSVDMEAMELTAGRS